MLDHEKYVARMIGSWALGCFEERGHHEITHAIRWWYATHFCAPESAFIMLHVAVGQSPAKTDETRQPHRVRTHGPRTGGAPLIAEGLTNEAKSPDASPAAHHRITARTSRQDALQHGRPDCFQSGEPRTDYFEQPAPGTRCSAPRMVLNPNDIEGVHEVRRRRDQLFRR
jgi:hypothetical protein